MFFVNTLLAKKFLWFARGYYRLCEAFKLITLNATR